MEDFFKVSLEHGCVHLSDKRRCIQEVNKVKGKCNVLCNSYSWNGTVIPESIELMSEIEIKLIKKRLKKRGLLC